jgi:hypothetical protein
LIRTDSNKAACPCTARTVDQIKQRKDITTCSVIKMII